MVCNKYNEDGAKYLFKAIDDTNIDVTTFSDKELGDLIHVGMLEEIDELKKANVELQKEANLSKNAKEYLHLYRRRMNFANQ